MNTKGYSFADLCRMVGKDPFYVQSLQRHLGLYVAPKDAGYSQSYLIFLEKIVSLKAFHVPQDHIRELFEMEKKILCLLHVDSLSRSPSWYLDACDGSDDDEAPADRLWLTGHRLGFPMDAPAVQHALDFGERDAELFKGKEMGEDIGRVLNKYLHLLRGMKDHLAKEKPVIENALYWTRRFLKQIENTPK